MVRNFPATTRQRCPRGRDRVRRGHRSGRNAHRPRRRPQAQEAQGGATCEGRQGDLEDSSQAASKAHRALHTAWAQLHQARATLAVTRGKLAAAQALDEQMQHELVRAEVALSQARDDLRAGREKVKVQQRLLAEMASESMQQADPQLIGLWAMLKAQNPSDLTTQLKTVGNLVDRETTPSTSSRPRAPCSRSRRARSRTRRCRSSRSARPPPRTSCSGRRLETKAAEAEDAVTALVQTRRTAQDAALRAKHADERTCGSPRARRGRISRMLAAGARHHSVNEGNHGPLMRPVPATSPRRSAGAGTRSTATGASTTAPTSTPPAARPIRAAADGRVISEYYQSRLGQPALSSTSVGSVATASR